MIEEHDLESELINSELGELHEGWAIKDDSAADWAIEKIAKLETEYRRKEMVAQNKIAQIQQWLDKERAWKEQQRSFFEEKLREYFDTLPEDEVKVTKTQKIYKLPSGTLRLKQQQPEFKRDEAALLEWVKANKPRLVRIKESVDWAALKELIAVYRDSAIDIQSGETIDGVRVIDREPKFEVEVR
jgi:phage host-nuclease inhibitor protein Gam